MSLRNQLIRLAHEHPEHREKILPLVMAGQEELTQAERNLLEEVRAQGSWGPSQRTRHQQKFKTIKRTKLVRSLEKRGLIEPAKALAILGPNAVAWSLTPKGKAALNG